MVNGKLQATLRRLAAALIDQEKAEILVEPHEPKEGFWFGGGNVIRDRDGSLLLCGRYQDGKDRGLELAIFRAEEPLGPYQRVRSFSRSDLAYNGLNVLSIEGAALHLADFGLEVFVSTEKDSSYPDRIAPYQKAGAGVWSIDGFSAESVDDLDPSSIDEVVPDRPDDIGRLHCKDPWVADLSGGDLLLGFCTHPFSWSSSGTAAWVRRAGFTSAYEELSNDMLRRGPVWDIAAARITDRLPVPRMGLFRGLPALSLYFYDSCESLRKLSESPDAVSRPRGWSCEEIGGLAVGIDAELPAIESITVEEPLFVSPHGTGCSRYVSTLVLPQGILATWQQSQPGGSQALVGRFLAHDELEALLA